MNTLDGGGKELIDENILEIIRKYLVVKDTEKKLFGEVFTPVELVCEMLEKLPIEVWKNPNIKWLDPANGIGNYPIVVYYKLMDSLKDIPYLKEINARSKHIIEKMLFMVELNPVNVKVCRKIFKMIDSNVEPNISNSNFLTEHIKWIREFKIDTFQIIMGNPPYQKKVGPNKTQHIWDIFVIESITNYLKINGYLVFVHPNGWRKPNENNKTFKEVFKLIKDRDLQHLTMRGIKDGAQTFGGSATNYDYYCLKNILTKINKTKINDIDRNEIELDLNEYDFIPSGKFNIFFKLINKDIDNKIKIIFGSDYHTQKTHQIKQFSNSEYKYPVVYTITQKNGAIYWYSNQKKGMFVPKVIWSNGAGTYPVIDNVGDYGLTQFSFGIEDKPENLEKIKNAMNDSKFIELMKYVKFTEHKYNHKIIGTFKNDFWKEFDYKTKHDPLHK